MSDDRTDPQYKLRWTAELRDKIEAASKANKRSMNAEIIARLEESFLSSVSDPISQKEFRETMERMKVRLDMVLEGVKEAEARGYQPVGIPSEEIAAEVKRRRAKRK